MLTIEQVLEHLPNVSIAYRNARGIALDMLPEVMVDLRSSTFTKYDKDTPFRVYSGDMGRLAKITEIDEAEANDSYSCRDWGLSRAVPFDIQTITPVKTDRLTQSVEKLTDQWLLGLEVKTKALVETFPADAVGTSWMDDDSDPIADCLELREKLLMAPTFFEFGRNVWRRLQYHPKVIALRNTFRPGSIRKEDLADILEVEKILVSDVKVNSANKNKTAVHNFVWKDSVFAGYRPSKQILAEEDASWAAIFKLRSLGNPTTGMPRTTSQIYRAEDEGTLVRVWEEPDRGSTGASVVALSNATDLKTIGTDLGRRLTGTMA